jgi:hypothetical protein
MCKAGSATERDAIHFALGTKKAKTIVLGSQLPAITDPSGLSINGQKAKITISGNEQVRVFEVVAGGQGQLTLSLSNLTVADGRSGVGAGLLNNDATVKVRNTTFSNNSASQGGGIFNNSFGTSTLTVTNSTFSNNSGEFGGGGIYNVGTLEVTNSTFSENSAEGNSAEGGGIFNRGSTAKLRNTIVANSTSGGNCGGTITDGGYNLDDGTSCGFTEQQDSLPSTDPLLADQLAFNGGPTKTIALLKGSPAINAIPKGENGCATEIKTDQRGVSRPQGSGCDIGAFERKVRSR